MEKKDIAKAFLCGAFSWGCLTISEPKFEAVDTNLVIRKSHSLVKLKKDFIGDSFNEVGEALTSAMATENA